MENQKSTLNPNARPYVPLYGAAFGLGSRDEDEHLGSTFINSSNEDSKYHPVESILDVTEALRVTDREPSTSDNNHKNYFVPNFSHVEEYLTKRFPDIVRDYIADVFYFNDGELEDTIIMLEHFECMQRPCDQLDDDTGFSDEDPHAEAFKKDSS